MNRLRLRRLSTGFGALGLTSILALTGCGSARDAEGPSEAQSVTVSAPTVSAPTVSSRPADSQEREQSPKCRAGDPLAVGHSPVDAALGLRALGLDVRNCTSRPLTLHRPVLVGVTGSGRTGSLRLAVTPVANRPDKPFVLAPRATASAGVTWRVEPLGNRVGELRVTAARSDTADALPLAGLEMRLGTRLDYYPWVSQPDKVFSS